MVKIIKQDKPQTAPKWNQKLEDQFQEWYASILHTEPSMEPYGRNPDPDDPRHEYDTRGFWNYYRPELGVAGLWNEETQSYHGSDLWKQPGSREDTYGEHPVYYKPTSFYLGQLDIDAAGMSARDYAQYVKKMRRTGLTRHNGYQDNISR